MIDDLIYIYQGANKSGASPNLGAFPISKPFKLSLAKIKTGANQSGAAVFSVKKNGVEITTVTIANGARLGQSAALDVNLIDGDEISFDLVSGSITAPVVFVLRVDDGVVIPTGTISLPETLSGKNGYVPKINEFTNKIEWLPVGTTPVDPLNNALISGISSLSGWFAQRLDTAKIDGDIVNPLLNYAPAYNSGGNLPKVGALIGATHKEDLIKDSLLFANNAGYSSNGAMHNWLSNGGAYSIVAVIKPSAFKGTLGYDHATIVGSSTGSFSFGIGSDGRLSVMHNGVTIKKMSTALSLNTIYCVEVHYSGALITLKATGLTDFSEAYSTGIFEPTNAFLQIGCCMSTNGKFEGRIFEVITTLAEMTAQQKLDVRGQMVYAYEL